MFEVGREYMFTTGVGHETSTWWGEVTEIDLPLITACLRLNLLADQAFCSS